MKLGFVIPSLHGGGAEFVTRSWISELHNLGHEVFVYTYDERRDQQTLPAEVQRRHFPMQGRAAKTLLLPLWLRRTVAADQLQVIVCMMTFTNLVGVIALKFGLSSDTALVISERNMPSMLLPRFGASGRMQLIASRLLYRRADAAIAISHPVAGDLVSGLRMPPEKTFVVPNPVVREPSEDVGVRLPQRLKVGYVGRLVAQKRPERLIGVLESLASREIDVEGVVIGDGPLRASLAELAREKGLRIEFRGWIEPWMDAAGDFDCLLLPSAVEGFGNVLVEAAERGIPSVASSGALGVADAVVPGLTGELAIDDTPEQLARAVLRAVDDSEKDPMKRWLRRFSVASSTEALVSVLSKVTDHPPA